MDLETRVALTRIIEQLIDILDMLEGNADLEGAVDEEEESDEDLTPVTLNRDRRADIAA